MTDTVSAPTKRGANGTFSIGDRDRAGRAMRQDKFAGLGLTFDDVLLAARPPPRSCRPRSTPRPGSPAGSCSGADLVRRDGYRHRGRMAIALAREGGIGVIHRNLSIEDQVAEVDKVKRSESGMIVEPVTLPPDAPVRDALAVMEHYHISGVPITEDGRQAGRHPDQSRSPLHRRHRAADQRRDDEGNLITAPAGTTLDEAQPILHRHRVEKLPVVDEHGYLTGLITVKDIQKKIQFPNATKD